VRMRALNGPGAHAAKGRREVSAEISLIEEPLTSPVSDRVRGTRQRALHLGYQCGEPLLVREASAARRPYWRSSPRALCRRLVLIRPASCSLQPASLLRIGCERKEMQESLRVPLFPRSSTWHAALLTLPFEVSRSLLNPSLNYPVRGLSPSL